MEADEGRALAQRYCCVFYEVSAAEPDQNQPEELSGLFNQLIREARQLKLSQQESQNNNNSLESNNNSNNGTSRQRKRSVFIIHRMFGSLMGRNSMPPELPSTRKGGASQFTSSMPNVAGSFRSVFKKRSV